MKVRLLSILLLAVTLGLSAKPQFQAGKKYLIASEVYIDGCVSLGSTHDVRTPLYYLDPAELGDDCYWYITEEQSGYYSIRNVASGQYVTYTGTRDGETGTAYDIRYVDVTSTLDEDDALKSMWTVEVYSGNYFTIRNASATTHIWDVRVSPSYVVGTYESNNVTNNQRFAFYDEDGNLVEDISETVSGYDVSSWLVASTDGLTNWSNNGWQMAPHGNYYNGEASVVYPFIEKWVYSSSTLANSSVSQTLYNLPAGDYTLQADMIAVQQSSNTLGTGVYLFAGDQTTSVGTYNEAPQRFTVDFTISSDGSSVTLGARTQRATANWVAIDNVILYYHATETELISGELKKLRADAPDWMTAEQVEEWITATDGSFEQLEQQRKSMQNASPLGFNVNSWLVADTDTQAGKWSNKGWKYHEGGYYTNGEASIASPFYENWHQSSNGPLADNSLTQTLKNLPAGDYVLQADMIAVYQGSNTPATGITLFAGDNTTDVSTYNEAPQRYTIEFTLNEMGNITLGARAENTTANWIAMDNLNLYYNCSMTQLIESELAKLRADAFGRMNEEEVEDQIAATSSTFGALEELRLSIMEMPNSALSLCAQNITIKGRSIFYMDDNSSMPEQYLCSISEKNFGTNFTDTVAYTSINGYGQMKIDGTTVPSGSTYIFQNVSAGKTYEISFTNGSRTVSYPLTFTSLPIVRINGDFSNTYSQGDITVAQPNKKKAELLNMKAKWRGGITNSDGKHKRNYHVKFLDENGNKLEKRYFDLRKDNSWILESCQVDMARIRNRVLTDLWNDYRTDPYYIDQEPEALTGTRGEFVELILNDEYRGIYCMTENMDRKQMKLKKYDDVNGEMHGQLWKSKEWSYATLMGTSPDGGYYPKTYLNDPDGYSEMWDSYAVKYPDIEDVSPTDWTTLYNAVDFVCHTDDDNFKAHVAEYFDLPVVVDYYILMETILATDNHGKNMLFATYDKQADKKITFGVWDMDATCGQRWSDEYYHDENILGPEQDYAAFIADKEHGDYNLFKRLRDTDAESFNQRVAKRYRDLRQTYLATDSILQRFRTYFQHFQTAGADQREYARWSGDSDIAGKTLNFYDADNTTDMNIEYNYITDWFTRRMNYLDTTRFGDDLASLPANGDVDLDGSVTTADAQAIANYILRRPATGTFNDIFADVNGDGHVTIADVTAAVNIALER